MTESEVGLTIKARDELRAAPHGDRASIKARWASCMGVSVRQLERYLNRCGRVSGRVRRSDAGDTSVDRDAALTATAMVMASVRANGKRTLSVTRASDIVAANGIEMPVGAGRLTRKLWSLGLHPTQLSAPDPASSMRSDHPLHVVQVDASIPTLYYLDESRGLRNMGPVEFNDNKPDHFEKIARKRLLRYAIRDHYSGYGRARYCTGGESVRNLLDFLLWAFTAKGERDPLRGVPRILILDPGAANVSDEVLLLMDRLNVRVIVHSVGNARAKGGVEGFHNRIECEFEGRLKFEDIRSVEQINALADTWGHHFNETVPIVRKDGIERNRVDLLTSARPEQVMIPPNADALRLLVESSPEHRRVADDVTISFAARGRRSRIYSVRGVPHVFVGGKVEVITNPFCLDTLRVRALLRPETDDTWHTVAPQQFNAAGFAADAAVWGETFAPPPQTEVDRNRNEVLLKTYGVDTLEEAEAAQRKRARPLPHIDAFADVKVAQLPDRLPRATTDLQVDGAPSVAPLMLSVTDALFRVRDLVGRHEYEAISARVRQWIGERYAQGVPETAIAGIVAACTTPADAPVAPQPLRLVSNGSAQGGAA
jgi:hypothetical protein